MQEGPSSPLSFKIDSPSSINLKRKVSVDTKHFLLLIASFMLFVLVWSIMVLGKFYSLHSYVFDLGFIMQRLWQPYHVLTPYFATYILFSAGFQYILSPLYFLHSFQAILILQVIAIGISSFPLFSIARKQLQSSSLALIISITYLIYFPSAGILWFDVHFQAFFIPLFIFAYYLYTNNHYRLAIILFILSGTTRFPYMVFPFLFSIFELRECKLSDKLTSLNISKKKLLFTMLLVSTIFLATGAYFDFFIPQASVILSVNTPLIDRLLPLGLTLLFILGPILFIPVLRMKWFVMAIPLFALGLYSGNPNFTYPMVMKLQYTAMVVPIVFIGLIETIGQNISVSFEKDKKAKPSFLEKFSGCVSNVRRSVAKNRRGVLVSILIIIFVGSIFYQPYSPANIADSYVYNPSRDISFNASDYNALMSMIRLIPSNNPNVLFQNDMPELLPRPPVDNLPFLFSTYLSRNVTLAEVYNNTFPIINTFGQAEYARVDYLIAYTQSPQYYLQFNAQESTLPQLLSLMLSSGKYGILGEDMGFIVVERNYSKPPQLYKPLILNEPFNSTNTKGCTTFHDLSTIRSSSTLVTLVPGNYTITYYISVTNNSSSAHIYGALGYNFGKVLSESFNISASHFKSDNSVTKVTFNISVPNQESDTVFLISASDLVGNITVYGVSLLQTSY